MSTRYYKLRGDGPPDPDPRTQHKWAYNIILLSMVKYQSLIKINFNGFSVKTVELQTQKLSVNSKR